MKLNNDQSQDGNKDSSRGKWDQGQGPNVPGPNIDGGAGGGQWQPDQGPGQGLGGDWSTDQGGINKPTVDQGPAIDTSQGHRDEGGYDSNRDGFPENNGRVPQGNYKGGDTGRYPGDDPSQWRLEDSIPGTPGEDYPNYSTQTGFDCKQHENPGYYGDVEAQCQVFHICQADGRHNSFLCPLGTIFNQQYFVCVWWFNYDCADTTMYYNLNADLYKGAIGDTGGSDYGSGPVDGRVDSIIPPGVGVENAGQTGIVGPVARPPVDNGVQPGDYGSNEGFGQTGQDLRPPLEQPMNVPQGTWDGQKPQQNVGPRPDTAVVPGGQNTGYDQGGENGHDGGKRNFGNEGSKRNWGVKGGSTSGNKGGRWNNEQDVMANNWENDSSKKVVMLRDEKQEAGEMVVSTIVM
ncbi:hypothetical protein CEXT_195431 [Caerostris extrusa]|uniref:Chitin-binding type-2 domain-containing protein n=1 Tax=Caerostris extrusa TaxID=172846 RepID=A0AAV4UY77_CAEEX|nr:hypothetical protein CEXT_195431 [Caerostris extrusa]